MQTLVTVIHVFTCLLLIFVVLIQSGKGAEISTSLAGSSQTVFGSSGGANFFTRFTSGAAAVFMMTSVVLTIMGGQSRKSLFESGASSAPVTQSGTPASPTTTPAVTSSPAGTSAK
jgi:preprotein translocase subunit SecG